MLHFALCDDEKGARAAIREAISGIPGYRRAADICISEYCCGKDILADIEEGYEQFDLIFLDIYMDGLTGVETARCLREMGSKTPIVFLTTSPNFGVESYEVDAAGYLLKPIESEKLAVLLEKILSPSRQPRVALQCGRKRRYFNLSDILYAESFSHSVMLHLFSGETISCSETLSDLKEQLADRRFLRCHQSYIVNLEYVSEVRDDFILVNGEYIPIPVRRRREMADAYYRYFITGAVNRGAEREDNYV